MTDEPLLSAAQPEHLTDALRRCGVLSGGRVSRVEVISSRPTILSRIIRLRLAYDGDAADAPASLFLKTGLPEWKSDGWMAGPREVAFYREVAAMTPGRAVPRCFETFWDEATKEWHLLLEDLAETHQTPTVWPLPPTFEQCERIIGAWARFHAAWWDNPRFGVSVGRWGDAESSAQHVRRLADELVRFANRLGDRLSRERRDLYERLIAAAPRLAGRYHSHRHHTIVHGDAHVWNCFMPKDGANGDVLLFDWDSWRLDTATDDLAYMMALHWYPELRRQRERALLDRYHAELVAQGVRGYDRNALDDDYRLSALWQITTPVWQASINIPPVIWFNHLERAFLAVDDLGCRDLLA